MNKRKEQTNKVGVYLQSPPMKYSFVMESL